MEKVYALAQKNKIIGQEVRRKFSAAANFFTGIYLKKIRSLRVNFYDLFSSCLSLVIIAILLIKITALYNYPRIFRKRLGDNFTNDASGKFISAWPVQSDKNIIRLMEKKNIFAASRRQEVSIVSDDSLRKLKDVAANLRLAGIIVSEPPQAIIEYSDKQQLFYLKEGETFLEGIRLDIIKKGLVVLDLYGESIELYL